MQLNNFELKSIINYVTIQIFSTIISYDLVLITLILPFLPIIVF